MDIRISTGSDVLDDLLGGGLESEVITTVFGPAGSGKTNIALLCALQVINSGKKVLYIDSEASFSLARFSQLSGEAKVRRLLDEIVFLKPISFDEQKRAFASLSEMHFDQVGLVVVDSIAMLYRLEMGRVEDVSEVNRELSLQIGILTEIARRNRIPILVTNQVYSVFEERDKVSMVGGDILKYGSKCLIELRIAEDRRRAIIIKHRSEPEGKSVMFRIVNDGIAGFQTPPEPI